MADSSLEPRYSTFQVLGAVMDGGPQTLGELLQRLYPQGTRGRGRAKGSWVPAGSRSIQSKLDALLKARCLQVRDGRYAVHADLGIVWVIYVGAERVYAGVYDSACRPLEGETGLALTARPHRGLAGATLPSTLELGLAGLADLVMVNAFGREPGCLVVGLPASLGVDLQRIEGEAPAAWIREDAPPIASVVTGIWDRKRRERGYASLPDLPRHSGGLKLTADTDVVLDALGAMYDPAQVEAVAPAPRRARVLLAVKHSRTIRSTVVSRGPADLVLPARSSARLPKPGARRLAGERRDHVWRGAFGDTIGLGHSIALIYSASRENPETLASDLDWVDLIGFHEQRVRANQACSCGTVDPAHLSGVASHTAIMIRLREVAGLPDEADWVWQKTEELIETESRRGQRARAVLEESGRLLAYAIDTGVRLYDPEAVLVTGRVSFNETFWEAVRQTVHVTSRSRRRSLTRASDLLGDDMKRPIGPRGAAWLGLDTWVFPDTLAALEQRQATARRRAG